ncbi:MAG: methylated-DNA--[protein]-cysteine S-methyltransferase [Proteobacteria bacterium]|jgi:methylated-DNA-[protein]-cysteine S-methyltransferase|nr:methylated-DNA--[protein]-cysteine S-methyltransferase [Pseudomonadota bacterium]
MNAPGVTLFDTPIGRCGLAWRAQGIAGVQLPEAAGVERARLLRRFPDALESQPPLVVVDAIASIVLHLAGGLPDLGSIELDMTGVQMFDRRVYEIARAIPRGQTRSYGEIAAELGDPGAARAVGQALGRNPFPIIVPCHRVLAAAGRPGGFSAHGGVATKLRLLAIEGAPGNAEFDF